MTITQAIGSSTIIAALWLATGCQNSMSIESADIQADPPSSVILSKESKMTDANTATDQVGITPKALSRYHWTLVSAIDSRNQPIVTLTEIKDQIELNFGQQHGQHILRVSAGCNSMQGGFSLMNNVLDVKSLMSTRMLCADVDEVESQLAALVQGNSQLSYKPGSVPMLTQVTENAATLVWQGTLTAEAKYGQEETIFWKVSHQTQPCPDGSTKTCLKIKPVTYDDQGIKTQEGDWRLFDGKIEGFTHDSDHDQVLRIKKFIVDPSDVKGKHFAYVLDTVVESQLVK